MLTNLLFKTHFSNLILIELKVSATFNYNDVTLDKTLL